MLPDGQPELQVLSLAREQCLPGRVGHSRAPLYPPLSQDYVTEKFFKILPYNVIPVVLNGANMSRVAPPHSYINVMDFNSTEELASHLHRVDQDDKLFASYFWWRDYYTVKVGLISSSTMRAVL